MIRKNIITLSIFGVLIIGLLTAMMFNHRIYKDTDMKIYDTVYLHKDGKEQEVKLKELSKLNQPLVKFSIYFEEMKVDDLLYFYSPNSNATFFNEEVELHYTYDAEQELYTVSLNGASEISVSFLNNKSSIKINELYICNTSQFSSYLLVKDMFYVTLILIALFSSLIIVVSVIIYSIVKRNLSLLFGYTVLFIFLSLWCLTSVDYFNFIFSNYLSLKEISTYLVMLFPVGALIASESIVHKSKFKNFLQVTLITLSFSGVVLLILHSIEFMNINTIVTPWFIVSAVSLLGIGFAAFKGDRDSLTSENTLLVKSTFILFTGMALEMIAGMLFLPGSSGIYITISLLIVYATSLNTIIVNYVKAENNRRFLSEENERLTSSILLSQIKPHFLYNALNSISFLCKQDPKKADIAVVKFSRYLRQNMKSIEDTDLIEFTNEVEHIKNYLYLEAIRFPNIEFKFEIDYDDFDIPPLCIQPIVENSVKHGASKNPDGGFVCLKSYRTNRHIIIEVTDNGVGFDDQKIIKGTGLSNISRRFSMHLNADVEFQSQIGKGTVVRVKIPRKDII